MRARNIKPAFFSNELLGVMDPIICLTFEGLWCLADRDGILEDRPLRIKAELFPYREGLDINGYLTVLERSAFIARYEVDGVKYIEVLNFRKHQSPHHTEKAKGYPSNPLKTKVHRYLTVTPPIQDREQQVPTRSDSLIPDSLIPDSTPVAPKAQQPKKTIHKAVAKPLPDNFDISDNVREWANKNNHTNLDRHLEAFKLACGAKGYTYVNFDMAFMKAIRDNWAKVGLDVRGNPQTEQPRGYFEIT